MNSKQRIRARFVLIIFVLAAGYIIVSLYTIQITHNTTYARKANDQYQKPAQTQFNRGLISFQSKDGTRVAAATLGSGYLIYMNPILVTNAATTYEALSQYLSINREAFMAQVRKNSRYEVLAERIDENAARSVKNLQLTGVNVVPETWRVYPGGVLAAHELGLVGEDASSTSVTGRYGLERSYEDILARQGSGSSVSIFADIFAGLRDTVFGGGRAQGSIVTGIEPTVQKYLEKVLSQTEKNWHPDEIGGIVIDPQDGQVYAMSSLPTFDPNNTAAVKKISIFSNPLVEHDYEMGSIMKPLTMAVALDTGAETPTSTYNDTGTMILSGKKISNYDGQARGTTPMQEILSQSLNVGAATIALKVGKDDFSRYFFNFGFADKTGIDLPNEAVGIVGNLKTGRDIEIATAAYGQGIAISPINMVRALSVLANGGYVITPHVATEIAYTDGSKKKIESSRQGPFLSKTTIEEVTRMLVKVVDEKIAKAHPDIHWEHYSVAAKTGTAQIPDPVNGGYYADRYLHSFFGYFPAYNPKFLVFLYQVYPKGAQFASETLTDPFSEMTKFLINYYDIIPDR